MREVGVHSFILHTRPFKNTSLLVDCLSLEQGLFSCVVQGAKRKASQHVNLFTPYWLQVNLKEGLSSLYKVEEMASGIELAGKNFYCGLYLNELLMRILKPFEPLPALFISYRLCLEQLAGIGLSQQAMEEALRQFELKFLCQLGYAIDFFNDCEGEGIKPGVSYRFIPETGFVARANGVMGEHILAMGEGRWQECGVLMAAKKIMRVAIDVLLNGAVLQSRTLFNSYLK